MIEAVRAPREPDPRAEIIEVPVIQTLSRYHFPVRDSTGSEYIVADLIVRVRQRREIFPAQPEIQRQIVPDLPVVLNEQRVDAGAERARAVRQAAGPWINRNRLELRRIVGPVQKRAELKKGPRPALFVVIVLVFLQISAKPQRVISPNLRHRVAKVVSVLRENSRRVPSLRRSRVNAAPELQPRRSRTRCKKGIPKLVFEEEATWL